MFDIYKDTIAHQFEAALCMLGACIERCPAANWHAPVANLKFCQAAFHALFFTDLYLGPDVESIREQPFHREHAEEFADYEELEDRVQRLVYERPFVESYLQHCREKAARVIAGETAESLAAPCGFGRKDFTRAELHVNNIRHLQHHAAQLSLRLRLDAGVEIPWVTSGWREF